MRNFIMERVMFKCITCLKDTQHICSKCKFNICDECILCINKLYYDLISTIITIDDENKVCMILDKGRMIHFTNDNICPLCNYSIYKKCPFKGGYLNL